MTHQAPPLQAGGAAVVGASVAKQLAFTGFAAARTLFLACIGLATAGFTLLRRGRRVAIQAGHALEQEGRE